jgi:hypothetical protein
MMNDVKDEFEVNEKETQMTHVVLSKGKTK